jgi:ATP-dependent Clp protease protease subunit
MHHIYNISTHLKIADLRHEPVLINISNIDEETVPEFRQAISMAYNSKQKVVPLIIDCYGGDVHSLLSMIDTIKNCKLDIATVIVGKAIGAAAILASCGKKGLRFIGENASVMLNDITNELSEETDKFKPESREIERLNKKLCNLLDTNTGHEEGFFKKLFEDKANCDWYLEPDDCIDYGLIDHKKLPHFEINVYTKYKFDNIDMKEVNYHEAD